MTFTAIGDTLGDNFLTIILLTSFWTGFYFLSVTGPFKTLNRLCSNNSDFQVDRGVSEGFSVELARDRTCRGKGTSIVQD